MAMTLRPAAPIDGHAVLPLAAAKAHLRRLDDDEDAVVAALRDSAIDWVERHTSRALAPRDFVATFDAFEWRLGAAQRWPVIDPLPLRLPIGPVTAVANVAWLDQAGASQPLADTAWRLAGDALLPAVGQLWPVAARGSGAVTVQFTAGFAAGECPPGLIAAVKMLLQHWFANRAAAEVGARAAAVEVPFGVAAICEQHRVPVLA